MFPSSLFCAAAPNVVPHVAYTAPLSRSATTVDGVPVLAWSYNPGLDPRLRLVWTESRTRSAPAAPVSGIAASDWHPPAQTRDLDLGAPASVRLQTALARGHCNLASTLIVRTTTRSRALL